MDPSSGVATVLFDLDGTLADTLPDLARALAQALAESGLEAPAPATLRPLVSQGSRAMVQHACRDRLDAAGVAALRERFLELYLADIATDTALFEGMPRVLDALERRGLAWGVVTSKIHRLTLPLLESLGLAARAACIVSGDSTPEDKPHPRPLLHAARLAGARPEQCVYVGDARKDVEAGRRAGMRTVVALWGYVPPGEDPATWGADAAIASPDELLAWLDALPGGA